MNTTPSNPVIYNGIGNHEHDRIAIIVSKYLDVITDKLFVGASEFLLKHKVERIEKFTVPGSFELPFASQAIAKTQHFDAIIALGCILTGETKHNLYISDAVANGLMRVSLKYKTPVIFGVLTPDTLEQAHDRAGGKHGHKGTESALAALEMIDFLRAIS